MFDAAFPPPVIGGKEQQALILSEELIKQGCKVKALTHNKYIKNNIKKHNGIEIIRFKFCNYLVAVFKVMYYLLILRKEYKLIHIHNPSYIGQATLLIGKFLRYKTVFKVPSNRGLNAINTRNKFFYSKADLLVCLNSYAKEKLSGFNNNVTRINNGVIVPKENPYLKRSKSGAQLTVLFVGRFIEDKDIYTALKSFICLNNKLREEIKLVLLGDGNQYSEVVTYIKEHNIMHLIEMPGFIEDKSHYYQEADIYLSSSKIEGMSNTILEAMAHGIPVISTNVGAASDQLGSKYPFLLQKVGDHEGICNAMKTVLINPSLAQDISDYLYNRSKVKYSITNVAKDYLQLYSGLLKNEKA